MWTRSTISSRRASAGATGPPVAPPGTDFLSAPSRLVVDANVLIAAFLKDSTVRRIFALSLIEFLAPQFLFEELDRHLPDLRRRAGLSPAAGSELVGLLRDYLVEVSADSIRTTWTRAAAVMDRIDPRDTAYVATALAVPCDGLWSDDAHLKTQGLVPCWTTKELVAALREDGFAF